MRQGRDKTKKVSEKMLHDIQVILSRLVAKAPQLIGNFTTNLAEAWMHTRCKFDGGKVINRSQSGSWEYRCMGVGLRLNMGHTWGPTAWSEMTTQTNPVYSEAMTTSMKKADQDRKRKATSEAKESRRQSKYTRVDETQAARKAYSRHDSGTVPDEVIEDVSPDYLAELCHGYYRTKVIVTKEEVEDIERDTRDQGANEMWRKERRKRITASVVGGICKMQIKTKRCKKVEALLYSKFKGNQATQYGTYMEPVAREQYVTYQQQNGHPGLTTIKTGLVVSLQTPWLAATPDDQVYDPTALPPQGLAEYKNPYAARLMTVSEACEQLKGRFCLERYNNNGTHAYRLKRRHDYYFQVQCQLYCTEKEWCDFVVHTEQDIHVERINRDKKWWDEQSVKLQTFYFKALLPELAHPRFTSGGIREPQ